jgi:hypothetical protein
MSEWLSGFVAETDKALTYKTASLSCTEYISQSQPDKNGEVMMAMKSHISNYRTSPLVGPKILIVEPDRDALADRALLLSSSNYSVFTAGSYREIFGLRDRQDLYIAVLSDTLGGLELRYSAEYVRWHWPFIRILVLGIACAALEDNLYDEAVDQRVQPNELLDTLARLIEGACNKRFMHYRTELHEVKNSR